MASDDDEYSADMRQRDAAEQERERWDALLDLIAKLTTKVARVEALAEKIALSLGISH